MSKYAQAAVDVVRRCQNKKTPDLKDEWQRSMKVYFPSQEAARSKSCPKYAFLGLCESGMVAGIPAGHYGVKAGNLNKAYALNAAQLALDGMTDKKTLWIAVAGDPSVSG